MSAETVVRVLAVVLVSYLLGSIPTAYLIARAKSVNIFSVGSGNMGGTNVARSLGCKWGILVAALDALKGTLAVFIAMQLMPANPHGAAAIAAIVAVVGHNWSLFVAMLTGRMLGGKGAATAFGTALLIVPVQVFAVICVTGFVLIVTTRLVSLGAIAMTVVGLGYMLILTAQNAIAWEYTAYAMIISALIIYRFRGNIQRLLAGTERRLGERA